MSNVDETILRQDPNHLLQHWARGRIVDRNCRIERLRGVDSREGCYIGRHRYPKIARIHESNSSPAEEHRSYHWRTADHRRSEQRQILIVVLEGT